ncbi:uncharacterized protein [Spinacia oleracea]|uniref:Reverse transcriptase domain-containing protein n=1 Tax=Spinacia oleracea TaxID=3562 RepID=A0ABM3QQR3_SPIOL|nr:uncharacterized protein LOC130461581 [Spinacia oleracea]
MSNAKYNSTADPEDHCTAFEQHIMLHTYSYSMWCKGRQHAKLPPPYQPPRIDDRAELQRLVEMERHGRRMIRRENRMPVCLNIMVHVLTVDKNIRPIERKKRNFSTEKIKAFQQEVDKLLAADFIEPCDYPEWLANVVMAKKPSGAWRICMDFTNLNGACPKDCYPPPRIDSLVKTDTKKATFNTDDGVYNYKKGRNIKVYVDDLVVKSREAEDHVDNLRETFMNLQMYQIKLNPKKCIFGVKSRKFMCFLVSEKGIDENLNKVEGMDIIGQFTTDSGGRKFLTVTANYFTKWIKAKPVAKITVNQNNRHRQGTCSRKANSKDGRALPDMVRDSSESVQADAYG